MSLNLPETIEEIYIKLANDVKNQIEKSNPFLNKSLVKAELTAFAGRLKDVYTQINALVDESFDDTRDGDYLLREAADYGITLKPATSASGTVSVVGVVGTNIPDDSELNYNSLLYKTVGDIAITNKLEPVALTYSGGIVSAVFTVEHNLGNGQEISITGCPVTALDDTYEVTVIDEHTVQFEDDIAGSGTTSASADYDNAVVSVMSKATGESYNRNQGEVLEFSTAIPDVTLQAVVTPDGIGGGTDMEDPEELRARLQYRKKNPSAHFNVAEVTDLLMKVSFVQRVFVERCTPGIGFATIYFVKEDNEIPSGTEVQEVKDYFEEFLPINDNYENILILAPSGITRDFVFSSIFPNTNSMQAAVLATLEAYFLDYSNVDESITEEAYKAAIMNTVDLLNLERLTSFELLSPTGDLVVTGGQINVLGSVSF